MKFCGADTVSQKYYLRETDFPQKLVKHSFKRELYDSQRTSIRKVK